MYDCNDWNHKDYNLCTHGTQFIKNYRSRILDVYDEYARETANIIGRNGKIVWLIEPDFYQYHSDDRQVEGKLSGDYMAQLFSDIIGKIKAHLPNAKISFDISAWANDYFSTWWGYFRNSHNQIDFIHTSGGESQGDSDILDPHNRLTWSRAHEITGKPIIADCGYGVVGVETNSCNRWAGNIYNRKNNGVVALSIASNTRTFDRPGTNANALC